MEEYGKKLKESERNWKNLEESGKNLGRIWEESGKNLGRIWEESGRENQR